MRRWSALVSFVLIVGLMAGCDSRSNIDDPELTHFLKFYGGDGDQTGNDFVALPDGSFVLFGSTTPSGIGNTSQWYLVKADSKGMILWEKRFGSPLLNETASDIEFTNDNRLVAVGNSYKNSTDGDVRIMTFTMDGVAIDSALVALKNLSNQDTDEDALSVSLTLDGFIVAGSTSNTDLKPNPVSNDKRDAMHLRFYNNLTQYPNSWGVTHGPGTFDAAVKVVQVSATQYYLFGYSNTLVSGHAVPDLNYWVFGLGINGDANTADLFLGSITDDEKASSVAITPPQSGDGYLIGGITTNATGVSDIYVAKIRKTLSFGPTDIQFQKPLSVRLGSGLPERTSVFASQFGGFFILANEKSFNSNQNWLLTKLANDGSLAWTLPIVFGGEGLDTVATVQELPDGTIVMLGTMRTGKADAGEFKMTLIKVNKDGKLAK